MMMMMMSRTSIRNGGRYFLETACTNSNFHIVERDSPIPYCCPVQNALTPNLSFLPNSSSFVQFIIQTNPKSYQPEQTLEKHPCKPSPVNSLFEPCSFLVKQLHVRRMSSSLVELKTDKDGIRFSFGGDMNKSGFLAEGRKVAKKVKTSKKKKVNELRFYRLKAKKKMKSPNPEVRIRYSLGKAKRKEAWLIEKLRKYEMPKAPAETHDPEILTEEEKFYLKRTGEKKKNFVLLGRRGVFGGVVLNMHLHWKHHETVKVICKPCKPGEVYEFAKELARLSKGIVIDIKPNNTIIFYRGKNYVQPKVMSPPDTLSKAKALEKYRYEQSLEHTSQFIEKLEKELEEYHEHLARYRKRKENASSSSVLDP